MSNSVWPHRWHLTRLLCPWDFSGKSTGVGCHFLPQARVLEWVAISFHRGSSWPRDQTQVSHIAGRFVTIWATREACDSWRGGQIQLLIISRTHWTFSPLQSCVSSSFHVECTPSPSHRILVFLENQGNCYFSCDTPAIIVCITLITP